MWKGTFVSLPAFGGVNLILFLISFFFFCFSIRSGKYMLTILFLTTKWITTSALLSPLMAKARGIRLSQCTDNRL